MIDFIFWNLVLTVGTLIIIRSKNSTITAATYFIILWVVLTFVATTEGYEVQGFINQTNEYHELYSNESQIHPNEGGFHFEAYETHNETIIRDTYIIPQNFLDVVYTFYMLLLTLYSFNKITEAKGGQQIKKILGEYF